MKSRVYWAREFDQHCNSLPTLKRLISVIRREAYVDALRVVHEVMDCDSALEDCLRERMAEVCGKEEK